MEKIDDLINDASEYEGYVIQDGDWDQLELMLDNHDRKRKIGWFWKGILVLMLIGIGVLTIKKWTQNVEILQPTLSIADSKMSQKNVWIETTDRNSVAKVLDTLIAKTENISQTTSTSEGQIGFRQNNSKQPVDIDIIKSTVEESRQNINYINNLAPRIDDRGDSKFKIEETNHLSLVKEDSSDIREAKLAVNNNSDSTFLNENEEGVDNKQRITDSIILELSPVNRSLHFYLGAGTEWSSISPMQIGSTKLKLQIGIEYFFVNKWSVLTGLNYTVKDYRTNSDNYTVKPGFWTNGIKPSIILAECKVVEVPLNLRYYFANQYNMSNSFYLAAGTSSYLMASERYRFVYQMYDPELKQEWNGKWENTHYFSILNLSIGYQKKWQINWSILVEPYVSLPLSGIGFGQVDLISFGASLQLKY